MKTIQIETIHDRFFDLVVEEFDVVTMAHVLEDSKQVKFFFVQGMNVKDQQSLWGVGGFLKWTNPYFRTGVK